MASENGQGPRREGTRGPREGGQRGDRRDGRGRGDRKDSHPTGGQSGAEYRVVQDVSRLEKALTLKNYDQQQSALQDIVKALRPLRLRSIDQLDFTAKGRLMTTLLRVQRQPKPAKAEAPESVEVAPEASEAASAESAPEQKAAVPSEEGQAAVASEPSAEPAAKPAPSSSWEDVVLWVGRTWRSVGDEERAKTAIEQSGKADEPLPEPAAERSPTAGARSAKGPSRRDDRRKDRPESGARKERGPERKKEVRGRPERENIPVGGNWAEVAKGMEDAGRTRDAARVHEKNKSYSEAMRLFLLGKDQKNALRAALAGKDMVSARALLKDMKPEEFRPVLEGEKSYELLMEHYVASGDFDGVARLYERARQFDQAALAWERAGKFGPARKAFERTKDTAGVERMRGLEVEQLLGRGDRLGAATLLVSAGQKEKAVEVISALPPPKAFYFLQRLKLEEEAKALAQAQLSAAEAEGKHSNRARWLEQLGERQKAADAWLAAERKDKALVLFEQLEEWPKAAELAENLGRYDQAVELYRKAGNVDAAERVLRLPRPTPAETVKPVEDESADESGGSPTSAPASEPS